jgi:hypothetical protein
MGRFGQALETLNQMDAVLPGADAASLALRSVLVRKRGDLAKADTLEQNARRLDAEATSWAIQRATENIQNHP